MVNSLSRLTREALAIQKYTDARSRSALRELDPKRKLDESETRAIVRKVDEILGLAHCTSTGRDELRESPLSSTHNPYYDSNSSNSTPEPPEPTPSPA